MKHNNRMAILVLTVLLLSILPISALAAGEAEPTVSNWAQQEVQAAQKLGIVPELYDTDDTALTDLRKPITRAHFRQIAMEYVAYHEHYDLSLLEGMVKHFLAAKPEKLEKSIAYPFGIYPVFTDGDYHDSIAYYLGLVEGRDDGIFDPNGLITRQEAAVMLTRAHEICGGSTPHNTAELSFIDIGQIADWAQDSIAALVAWNVMNGMEDGSFAPKNSYSVEQCIVTFYRLSENGPVSRKNSNVTPLFSYEQCLDFCLSNPIQYESLRIDGPAATFLRIDTGGVMRSTSWMVMLYPGGGMCRVYPVVEDTSYGFTEQLALENPRFSDDGQTFFYTMTLTKDTVSYWSSQDGIVLHEKGAYHVTVDVDTCAYTFRRED